MPQKNSLIYLLSLECNGLSSLIPKHYSIIPPCTPIFVKNEVLLYQPEGWPKQALIDGEIWPPVFTAESVRSAKKLVPNDADIFVCTYPKCGTTWIQHITGQLIDEEYYPEKGKELCITSPMIEKTGAPYVNCLKSFRLLKTHFSYQNCPRSSKAKYIYAVRNPKDCLTSYFFHNRNFKIYNWTNGDFDTFFELFLAGQLGFGDYFSHLKSWLPHIHNPNVLFLKYEDMVANRKDAIVKIGKFLGGRAEKLVNNPESLEKVVEESGIEAMKENQERWFPASQLHKTTFIRKGESCDWKNYMNKEQSDRMDQMFKCRLTGTEAINWWKQEMNWD